MAGNAKRIPDGFHTVTPHLVVKDAVAAISFYKKAFGAEELFRMPGPGGQGVMHAEIKIGNSILFLVDEMPGGAKSPQTLGGTPVSVHLYVEDVDASFKRATNAGGEVLMPVADMFWGDRFGMLKDPFGHHWSIASHVEDVTPEQCAQRAEEFFSKGPCSQGG